MATKHDRLAEIGRGHDKCVALHQHFLCDNDPETCSHYKGCRQQQRDIGYLLRLAKKKA